MEKQHGVNIMAVDVQIGMTLDVAGEEVVGPEKVEMIMNVSNGMPCYMLQVTSVVNNQKGFREDFGCDRGRGRVFGKG